MPPRGLRAGGFLEVFKFASYIVLPIVTIGLVMSPERMLALVRERRYIEYTPEGRRPPTGSLREIEEQTRRS